MPARPRCLHVEADSGWLQPVRDALEGLDLELLSAESTENAKRILAAGTIDIVIQDLMMSEPESTYKYGFDLLRFLHHDEMYPAKTPIIIVTGAFNWEDFVEIINHFPRVIHIAHKSKLYTPLELDALRRAVRAGLRPGWRSR